MEKIPNELRYTKTHEWLRLEKDSIVTVGITDHAQHLMGDLVYVELPKLNKKCNVGDEIAVVESVKTAADVYSPLNGEVIEVNERLSSEPEQVNVDPYGKGWIFRIKIEDENQLNDLLDAKTYQNNVAEESE